MFAKKAPVLIAGLALFSMFFGAGDLLWPLILGGQSGENALFALLGLLITGVSLPLLGLMAMMLFNGKPDAFFGRIGKVPCLIVLFIVQSILGPLGSIPRILTLSFATMKPYLPSFCTSGIFSLLFCVLVVLCTLRKHRIIKLLGACLTPILLLCLAGLFISGFLHPPSAPSLADQGTAFKNGLNVGYNTLDLLASFLFAPLVLSHFRKEEEEDVSSLKEAFGKMVKASLIAGILLSAMYVGLTFLGSYYTPFLGEHLPEERLRAISFHLLGPQGAFIASVAVVLACLTTAIPLAAISADYIQNTLSKGRIKFASGIGIVLVISIAIAHLGFMGIAELLSPVLQILCPGLIVLSILNILHRLYEIKTAKVPVYAAFAISTISYALFL